MNIIKLAEMIDGATSKPVFKGIRIYLILKEKETKAIQIKCQMLWIATNTTEV